MDDDRRYGPRVRSLRLQRGLSLAALAEQVGHTKGWLSKVERGLLPLDSRGTIGALAVALGVSPMDITGEPYDLPHDMAGAAARDAIPAVRRALLDRPTGRRWEPAELHAALARVSQLQHAGRAGDAVGPAAALLDGLRSSAGGRDHRDIARLIVLCSYYTTSVLQAIGRHDLALLLTNLMDRAAAESDDPVSVAVAAVTTSYGLAQVPVGAYAAAVDTASTAADAIAGAPGVEAAAARGHLQLAAGFAASALRSSDEAVDRLAAAQAHAEEVGGASTVFGRHLGFGAVNVRLHQVAVGVELGHHNTAVAVSGDLTVEQAPTPERAACWLADLGRAHAALGQDAQALAAFRRAEQIAQLRTRLHPQVREAVADMVDRRHRTSVDRDLRGLAYRMGVAHR